MGYAPLRKLVLDQGINSAAPRLSPTSQATLDANGSWNHIVNGDGFIKPWSGATSQGAGTGSRKMVPFGNTWGGIKDIAYVDKTFVAADVNTGTETVTITNHGYQTGTSCQLTTSGSLPGGLSLLTTYYIIRVDANNIKFATSLVNALAGTAINLTSTGTGTQTVDVINTTVTASGSWLQDIGKSRWGIGSGQPSIEGVNVDGFTLSTNLQLQIAAAGVYGAPVQAGLAQPSAPDIGIVNGIGVVSNSMSAKIARSRPSTGAVSRASFTSAVVQPQANQIYLVFPAASTGQTHWRVYLPFQGFGGTGIHYLAPYGTYTDIPESVVAAGSTGGVAATGQLTFLSNPVDTETITVNGTVYTFKTVPALATDIEIGAASTDTVVNMVTVLEANDPSAQYVADGVVLEITYATIGAAGNLYSLADSSAGAVDASGAFLAGGVDATGRALQFNLQDGDLFPNEANFSNFPPPAATHALRLQTIMALAGCYSDSTTDPSSTNPGTAISISKENDYESHIPTNLLFLPEQVTDTLARQIDDYGFVACENSIHALQFVGDRGDDLPPCVLTTILPDIGIQYPHNWCHFRGKLVIYPAAGNLIMMDEQGAFDADFAGPVASILRTFSTEDTKLGYDPINDSLVVMNGKRALVWSFSSKTPQWRQLWLPDFAVSGSALSAVTAKRKLFFSMDQASDTAYSYDTASATAPLSFATNPQSEGGLTVQDIYEVAVALDTTVSTPLAIGIGARNLQKFAYRFIQVRNANTTISDDENSFRPDIDGKRCLLFGTGIGVGGADYIDAILTYVDADECEISVTPEADADDVLMFVCDYTHVETVGIGQFVRNLFPYIAEARSYQVGAWFKATGSVGNVLDIELVGDSYASSRAL